MSATTSTPRKTTAPKQMPFDALDIRRRTSNFRKLMQLFPIVHPAALHGLLVKSNYDAGYVMELLFRISKERNAEFWEHVNEKSAMEKAMAIQRGCQQPGKRYNMRERSLESRKMSPEPDH